MAPDRPEVLKLSLVPGDIRVNFRSVIQIKRDCFVNRGKFEGGELAKQHLGRESLVVMINEVVQSEAVP
jgi:hypothetical protein